jgi:hypothetical protein
LSKRKGIAPLNAIIILAIVIIVSVTAYRTLTPVPEALTPDNINITDSEPTEQPDEEPTIENPQNAIKEFNVTQIIIENPLVPSGIPVNIKVQLEKIRGQDPFSLTLSISGEPFETRRPNS